MYFHVLNRQQDKEIPSNWWTEQEFKGRFQLFVPFFAARSKEMNEKRKSRGIYEWSKWACRKKIHAAPINRYVDTLWVFHPKADSILFIVAVMFFRIFVFSFFQENLYFPLAEGFSAKFNYTKQFSNIFGNNRSSNKIIKLYIQILGTNWKAV